MTVPSNKTILPSAAPGLVICDDQGRVVLLSRDAAQLIGRSDGEVSGQSLGQALNLSEDDNARLVHLVRSDQRDFQVNVTLQGEPPRALHVTGLRWHTPGGAAYVALSLHDEVSDIDDMVYSHLLANVSHEFRTPLSALNASIELLLADAAFLSPIEMAELLNSLYLSTSGLQALVDNLLESVSIQTGHFVVHRRTTDLNRVCARAIQIMQPLLDRREQALSLTEPLDLPPIHADPDRLAQVLINLLANASKYNPPAGTIDLSIQRAGGALRVAVADRGPGIPPTQYTRLFRQFGRLNAQSTEPHGMGLGLAVARAIVEGHGGTIGVDERQGGGAVFWFTVPVAGEAA
jgi:signal transduction histidine kinase